METVKNAANYVGDKVNEVCVIVVVDSIILRH
jgi:hypothetical protein